MSIQNKRDAVPLLFGKRDANRAKSGYTKVANTRDVMKTIVQFLCRCIGNTQPWRLIEVVHA